MPKNPKERLRNKKNVKAYYRFRELLWKAVDEKDKNFSIIETAKKLGLHK